MMQKIKSVPVYILEFLIAPSGTFVCFATPINSIYQISEVEKLFVEIF